MCYEFSGWSWKRRAEKLAQEERDAAKAAKTPDTPVTPAQSPEAPSKVDKGEPVSA